VIQAPFCAHVWSALKANIPGVLYLIFVQDNALVRSGFAVSGWDMLRVCWDREVILVTPPPSSLSPVPPSERNHFGSGDWNVDTVGRPGRAEDGRGRSQTPSAQQHKCDKASQQIQTVFGVFFGSSGFI